MTQKLALHRPSKRSPQAVVARTAGLGLVTLGLLAGCGGPDSTDPLSASNATTAASATRASAAARANVPLALDAQAKAAANPALLLAPVANPSGAATTLVATGSLNPANPFFQAFGNGRACATCHDQAAGWTLTPSVLAARFAKTDGLDPVFLPVDGANSPLAPVATFEQRKQAFSMLLTKGVIRIGLPMPANAQFELAALDDPYGYASAAELSLFRRPLPTANLQFISAIMWDGRETVRLPASADCIKGSIPLQCFGTTTTGLIKQADAALMTHAQLTEGLPSAALEEIVGLTTSLVNSQSSDRIAGALNLEGATGGSVALAATPYYFGINDVAAGDYRTGARFNPDSMTMYGAWLSLPAGGTVVDRARASIARGEALFNAKRFAIVAVPGFNDALKTPVFAGTCTSCHASPNAGTQSVPRLMNTGVADGVRRTPDMPLYTLRNVVSGETLATTDPGLALQTGQWADIGKVKVPGLRALASRPPYFHNGSAADLNQVVAFYQRRFNINFTPQETADLVAFLGAL